LLEIKQIKIKKGENVMAKKKETIYIECQGENHTGKNPLAITNFYNSNSPMAKNGKAPLCKKCIKDMIDYESLDSVYKILQVMDIPFVHDVWNKVKNGDKDIFGNYLRQINSLPQFQGLRWKDSIFESNNISDDGSENNTSVKNKNTKFEIEDMTHEQLEDKYGVGYTDEEYYCFEKKWRKLVDSYGQKTSLHIESLTTYIRFRVKEELATAKGDVTEATKWGQLAEKAQQSGKLNVAQLSKSDISGGVDLVCQIFEAVESEVGIIPLLPKLIEQPMDDADMIIWSLVNYGRTLEDKPRVKYKEIWDFYNDMLNEYCGDKGMSDEQRKQFIEKRNNTFRDLGKLYKEPLYEGEYEGNFEEGDD
jgi:hypothetical protein